MAEGSAGLIGKAQMSGTFGDLFSDRNTSSAASNSGYLSGNTVTSGEGKISVGLVKLLIFGVGGVFVLWAVKKIFSKKGR